MAEQKCIGPIPSEAEVKQQIKDAVLSKTEEKVFLCHYGYGDPNDVDVVFYSRHPGAVRAIMQRINTKIARAENAKKLMSK